MTLYRLYLDESGDHTFTESEEIEKRYLGLVGCSIRREDEAPPSPRSRKATSPRRETSPVTFPGSFTRGKPREVAEDSGMGAGRGCGRRALGGPCLLGASCAEALE